MIVHELTPQQKDSILGKKYAQDLFFNPKQDADEKWFISVEEAQLCNVQEFAWVKDLPIITYNPVTP